MSEPVRRPAWKDTPCADCGEGGPAMFVLKEELWRGIAGKKEVLCLPCAEKRLGRRITFLDLKECGSKREMRLGALLALRALFG